METEVKQPDQPVASPPLNGRRGGWSTIALLLAFLCGWGMTFAVLRFNGRPPATTAAISAKASELVEKAKDVAAATQEKVADLSAAATTAAVKPVEPPPAVNAGASAEPAATPEPVTVAPKETDDSYLQERELTKKLMERYVETAKILSR
jgi:hypothetical protein